MGHAEEFFRNPNYAEYWSAKIRNQNYEEPYRREFLQALQATSGELLLEVGVGEGRNLLDLVSSGAGYVGIDISREMLWKTRQRIPKQFAKRYDLLLADAMWLPFRAFSFDKALCFATIFFVPDQAKAISEIQSVARRRIAIEFRNSRNPKVFLYSRAFAFTRIARPLLRTLVQRKSVRDALSLVLGRSRTEKLANQITVYGSLQPVFGLNVATLSKQIAKNGWRIESIRAYSMAHGVRSHGPNDNRTARFEPILVAHSVRESPETTLEIDTHTQPA